VDAVRVGAGRRRADEEAVDAHALAVVEPEVELRAVLDPQAAYRHVIAREESYELQTPHRFHEQSETVKDLDPKKKKTHTHTHNMMMGRNPSLPASFTAGLSHGPRSVDPFGP
jgi:PHD/YefM family antitoxin component YafN of YafNO toxin-antitoxin module